MGQHRCGEGGSDNKMLKYEREGKLEQLVGDVLFVSPFRGAGAADVEAEAASPR